MLLRHEEELNKLKADLTPCFDIRISNFVLRRLFLLRGRSRNACVEFVCSHPWRPLNRAQDMLCARIFFTPESDYLAPSSLSSQRPHPTHLCLHLPTLRVLGALCARYFFSDLESFVAKTLSIPSKTGGTAALWQDRTATGIREKH
jgi:hypothetical protein